MSLHEKGSSKFLTQKQITKRGQKSKKIIDWFWNESVFKIGLLVSVLFFLLTILSLKLPIIEILLSSLEPLGVLLGVVIFIKETPERKKQFNYLHICINYRQSLQME